MDKTRFLQKLMGYKNAAAGFLRARGMAAVVGLSLAAVGAAVAFSLPPRDKAPAPTPAPVAPVAQQRDQTLNEARASLVHTPAPTPGPTPTPMPDFTRKPVKTTPAPQAPRKASPPVQGEVIWSFARDELIYSTTLKQWMTHMGADVAAARGDTVRVIWAGTVEEVFTDDALGVTVTVLHGQDRRTVYANLAPEPPVKPGDRLNAGDALGLIGNTATSECGAPSHLHFEIWEGDEAADPEDYCLFLN